MIDLATVLHTDAFKSDAGRSANSAGTVRAMATELARWREATGVNKQLVVEAAERFVDVWRQKEVGLAMWHVACQQSFDALLSACRGKVSP